MYYRIKASLAEVPIALHVCELCSDQLVTSTVFFSDQLIDRISIRHFIAASINVRDELLDYLHPCNVSLYVAI
jgi:hypothetical protein